MIALSGPQSAFVEERSPDSALVQRGGNKPIGSLYLFSRKYGCSKLVFDICAKRPRGLSVVQNPRLRRERPGLIIFGERITDDLFMPQCTIAVQKMVLTRSQRIPMRWRVGHGDALPTDSKCLAEQL
jgi:hypothetical protein